MKSGHHWLTTQNRVLTTIIFSMSLLAACGGGGGGGGDNSNDPPPVADDETPTVSGRLWHDNYAIDFRDGSQLSSLNGEPSIPVDPQSAAWPWPDGSQYATTDPDTENTVLRVHTLADDTLLYQLTVDGYLRNIRPSPVSKSVILATWGEDSISTTYAVFYDLEQEKVLDDFLLNDSSVNWLPDGRYLRVSRSGNIEIGVVGGGSSPAGSFVVPDQREIHSVVVSPNGSQILLAAVVNAVGGGINESDLWIANIDGNGLRRFTKTGISYYGVWSPDSSHIAFDADTGLVCGGGSCAGTCELWYGKATAQDLDGLSESSLQAQFRVKNRHGDERILGCDLQAWTP